MLFNYSTITGGHKLTALPWLVFCRCFEKNCTLHYNVIYFKSQTIYILSSNFMSVIFSQPQYRPTNDNSCLCTGVHKFSSSCRKKSVCSSPVILVSTDQIATPHTQVYRRRRTSPFLWRFLHCHCRPSPQSTAPGNKVRTMNICRKNYYQRIELIKLKIQGRTQRNAARRPVSDYGDD